MKDYADKGWIGPATARSSDAVARGRERMYRRAANGAGWIVCALLGVLIGYNAAIHKPEKRAAPRERARGSLATLHCLKYDGCKACEKRGNDGRIIFASMAC